MNNRPDEPDSTDWIRAVFVISLICILAWFLYRSFVATPEGSALCTSCIPPGAMIVGFVLILGKKAN